MELKSKKPSLIDVPVFVTFFVRPEKFILVFNVIRQVRPSSLFLVADGPRDGYPDDYRLNEECKKIAENIDWDCTVYRKYSDVNLGIDNNAYFGLKWAFNYVDRVIFLEDDILPSTSFFPFCFELLEKYKDDKRIHKICGMNHLGEYDKPSADYFFSKTGSIWGFAFWRRSFNLFEEKLDYLTDSYALELMKDSGPRYYKCQFLNRARGHRIKAIKTGKIGGFELLDAAALYLNNSLMIVSSKNLISCIGISENSGHSVNHPLKLPRATRRMFYMQTYELQFPLVHAKYVVADKKYEQLVYNILGKNTIVKYYRKIEGKIRRIVIDILINNKQKENTK